MHVCNSELREQASALLRVLASLASSESPAICMAAIKIIIMKYYFPPTSLSQFPPNLSLTLECTGAIAPAESPTHVG